MHSKCCRYTGHRLVVRRHRHGYRVHLHWDVHDLLVALGVHVHAGRHIQVIHDAHELLVDAAAGIQSAEAPVSQ